MSEFSMSDADADADLGTLLQSRLDVGCSTLYICTGRPTI